MTLTLNIGPVHPSTHGVLRLLGLLDGETLCWIAPETGHLHRGTGKLLESDHFVGHLDRLDYVSVACQELLYVLSTEHSHSCWTG